MRLRAAVKTVKGTTRHYRHPDGLLPPPAWVELQPDAGGACFLFYCNADGDVQADTWHESIEDAKGQAAFEFDIGDADWFEVADGG
jgi:hypothetical protein